MMVARHTPGAGVRKPSQQRASLNKTNVEDAMLAYRLTLQLVRGEIQSKAA